MSKAKLISISIGITYDPNTHDRDEISEMFDGHDGGGYCFVDRMCDEFFMLDVTKAELSEIRKTLRNLRRRKGIACAGVSVVDEGEE